MAERLHRAHVVPVMTRPHVRHQATRGGFMKGCLIMVGIMAIICIALGIAVAVKWKGAGVSVNEAAGPSPSAALRASTRNW